MPMSELDWLDDDLHVEGGRKEPKITCLADNPGIHVHVHSKEHDIEFPNMETYEVRLRGFDDSEVGEILTIIGPVGVKAFEIIKKEVNCPPGQSALTKFTLKEYINE